MLNHKNQLSLENSNIINAIDCLKNRDLDNAKDFIYSILMDCYISGRDDNLAKAHNLLGIYYELNGNLDVARKQYRVSLAFDPTFKSADNNLRRICLSNFVCSEEYVDYCEYINESEAHS